jgi:hypothetical protein
MGKRFPGKPGSVTFADAGDEYDNRVELELLRQIVEGQARQQETLDAIKDHLGSIRGVAYAGNELLATISATFSTFLVDWIAENTTPSNPATSAVLTVKGSPMPGQITVDTTNETVTIGFVDDHGDAASAPVAASGSALVVTFASDNPATATVATDAQNPLQGDVSVLAEGTANLSATLAYADGSPVLEPDGSTPFAVPAAVAVTVGPGPAVGDALVLSV